MVARVQVTLQSPRFLFAQDTTLLFPVCSRRRRGQGHYNSTDTKPQWHLCSPLSLHNFYCSAQSRASRPSRLDTARPDSATPHASIISEQVRSRLKHLGHSGPQRGSGAADGAAGSSSTGFRILLTLLLGPLVASPPERRGFIGHICQGQKVRGHRVRSSGPVPVRGVSTPPPSPPPSCLSSGTPPPARGHFTSSLTRVTLHLPPPLPLDVCSLSVLKVVFGYFFLLIINILPQEKKKKNAYKAS
ncbi:hypothetical protein E2C01_032968 [Portunus trituberculatus]|uniref:Uncharacterized protein n=1 Tax=Portunus trituberculatus TaxID=210409 RepID=A0A5B7EXB4_PORTR|nr:hypothetical protein [Portunus trituberculatus]